MVNGSSFTRLSITKALESAGLDLQGLKSGSHPDDGRECLFLEATTSQYTVFIACLAVQRPREVGRLAAQVQLQMDRKGATRFWFPGMSVVERCVPRPRKGE